MPDNGRIHGYTKKEWKEWLSRMDLSYRVFDVPPGLSLPPGERRVLALPGATAKQRHRIRSTFRSQAMKDGTVHLIKIGTIYGCSLWCS